MQAILTCVQGAWWRTLPTRPVRPALPSGRETMVESPVGLEDQMAKVADRLASEYAGRVPDGLVRELVSNAYRPFRSARVTQFVPVLVDRSVRQQLRARP